MNEFRLALVLSDEALASALARAIAKEYRYILVHIGEWEEADYTIRDGFLGGPAPVWEIVDRALAASGKIFDFPRKPGSCPVTGFTSGGGGRGVSLCTAFYSAIAARGNERSVLQISFDPYVPGGEPGRGMYLLEKVLGGSALPLGPACSKREEGYFMPAQQTANNVFFELDAETAASFLQTAEDSGEWDEIVLDVPRGYPHWREIMSMCENCVVVFSREEWLRFADDAAYEELSLLAELRPEGASPQKLLRLEPPEDPSVQLPFPNPLGPLGCEVKALAERLEIS